MGRKSRNKGKRGERQAVEACKRLLGSPDLCKRTSQSDGAYAPDIQHAIPGFHVEVKARARIAALRFYEQALKDARKHAELGGDWGVPIVLLREDGDTEFYALLPLADVPLLAEAVEILQKRA